MINVLGLGNVLMGDDGFGPAVVHALETEYQVGSDVDVVDLGTPGLDVTPWLTDVDSVIIVDTITSTLPPGTIRIYDKSDVLRQPPPVRAGPHDPGVKDALLTLELAGRAPRELTLIGVVPARTDVAVNLSPSIHAAVRPALSVLVKALECAGAIVSRRANPRLDAPWWSRPHDGMSGREGL
jgi:hydrogenase maturation protease